MDLETELKGSDTAGSRSSAMLAKVAPDLHSTIASLEADIAEFRDSVKMTTPTTQLDLQFEQAVTTAVDGHFQLLQANISAWPPVIGTMEEESNEFISNLIKDQVFQMLPKDMSASQTDLVQAAVSKRCAVGFEKLKRIVHANARRDAQDSLEIVT